MEKIAYTFPNIGMNVYISENPRQKQLSALHVHPEMELMYVTRGRIHWGFSDKGTLTAQKGQGMFVNQRVPHSTWTEDDSAYILVQFSRSKLYASQAIESDSIHRFIAGEEREFCLLDGGEAFHSQLLGEMERILEEYVGHRSYQEIFLHGASIMILGLLLRNGVISAGIPGEEGAACLQKVMPVARYIEERCSTPISLGELADHAGFNPVYLCRLFKRATGRTLTEYINYVRVEKSLEKLGDPSLSITQAAFQSGFSSLSHFNSVFREQVGCAPSAYRKARLHLI